MDNQLDELKRHWKGLNSLNGLDIDRCGLASAPSDRSVSRRQKLLRIYRVLTIVGAVYIILGPALLYSTGIFPVWMLVCISAFFALTAGMCYMMYANIRSLDFADMPTVDLLNQVRHIYKCHIRQTCIGITTCIPLLLLMFWYFYSDEAMFLGGVCGAVFGGFIGWRNNLKIRRYLRDIEKELQSVFG